MRRASARFSFCACAALIGILASACSITMPLAGLDDEPAAARTTGSITTSPPALAFAPGRAGSAQQPESLQKTGLQKTGPQKSGSIPPGPQKPMALKADAPLPAMAAAGSGASSAAASRPAPEFPRELGSEDLRRAHGALGLALDPQGNGKDVAWSNPQSGMKGVIIPSGGPFLKDHQICRAFTASTVTKSASLRQTGVACRPSGGNWAIREMGKV
jgi:hypothetical protein